MLSLSRLSSRHQSVAGLMLDRYSIRSTVSLVATAVIEMINPLHEDNLVTSNIEQARPTKR